MTVYISGFVGTNSTSTGVDGINIVSWVRTLCDGVQMSKTNSYLLKHPLLVFHFISEPLVAPTNFEVVPGTNITAKSAQFQWDAVDPSPEKMRGEFRGYKVH